jgi:hypothetical protein
VIAIRRRSDRKEGTRSSGMAASWAGSGPAAWRPRVARGSGRGVVVPYAAGWAAGAVWLPSTGADEGGGGMPAGRAARPPPPDPRCGFLSWLRLFFRAIGSEPTGVYRERGKALDTSNGLWYKLTRVQHIGCPKPRANKGQIPAAVLPSPLQCPSSSGPCCISCQNFEWPLGPGGALVLGAR